MENRQGRKSLIFIIAGIIITIIVVVVLMKYLGPTVPTLAESDFKTYLEEGRVQGIIMTDSYTARVLLYPLPEGTPQEVLDADPARGYTMDDFRKNEKMSDFYVVITSRNSISDMIDKCYDTLMEKYEEDVSNGIPAEKPVKPYLNLNDPNSGTSWSSIISILSFVLIAGLAIIMLVSLRGGKGGGNAALNFGKNKARLANNVKVRFADVAGAEEEKEELREVVEFLKHPKRFTAMGAKIPRGVLLVGPPGTGKTLFAKAVAGEANVPFFSISGSDFVEMFVGVGASRVRDLFAQAKKNMPCIVFIDEIDAVGRQRGAGLGGGNDEREQTLNQLLVQMDGFDTNEGIIIMAATNRVDILDPALLRPGRFDRQVFVNMPDVKGREAIFKVHARNKPVSPEVDYKNLARLTSGFSGADIANLLNEAAILAARHNRQTIIMVDILEGINKVLAGPQKKSRVTTENDKRITAYHEAGHAIVGYLMKYCDAVQEVSIIPRGLAAGYTISLPKNDNTHLTINKLNDEIAMLLAGRASEEIVIQDISTGASNDIKRATDIARKMVCEWGMSDKLPNLFFGGEQEIFIGRDYQTQTMYGDKVADVIDTEIKKIVDYNYSRAIEVLRANREALDKMVKLLYARETIYGDEVDMIMEGRSLEEINAYIDSKQEKQKVYDTKPASPAASLIVPEPVKEVRTDTPAVVPPAAEEVNGTPPENKEEKDGGASPENTEK